MALLANRPGGMSNFRNTVTPLNVLTLADFPGLTEVRAEAGGPFVRDLATRALRVSVTPQILQMVAKVYVPVLFPLTFLIVMVGIRVDHAMGWPVLLEPPTNFSAAVVSFTLGVIIWLVSYSSIVFEGKGSPSPTAGRTQTLVTDGIYAYCRYPSVHGKLLGILGVGFAVNSTSFCAILVPLLLLGSIAEKVWRQDPQNHRIFGEAYAEYAAKVPMFIPWKIFRSS